MQKKKAQVNIEFIGGSILFFSALVFVIGGIFATLPKYGDVNRLNHLESTGIALGKKLINQKGYWESSSDHGTNWEDKQTIIENSNYSNLSLGLAKSYHKLDPDKTEEFFNGFVSDEYTKVKTQSLEIPEDFQIRATEFILIDTYRSFQKGKSGSLLTEPSGDPYDDSDTEETIHYGNKTINGETRWFLTIKNNDERHIYVSNDNDFDTDTNVTNSTETYTMNINGREYIHDADNTDELKNSERRILIFRREEGKYIGTFGRDPPEVEDNYVKHDRFVTLNSNPVKLEVLVW